MSYVEQILRFEEQYGTKKTLIKLAMEHNTEYRLEKNDLVSYGIPWYKPENNQKGLDWTLVFCAEQALAELGY